LVRFAADFMQLKIMPCVHCFAIEKDFRSKTGKFAVKHPPPAGIKQGMMKYGIRIP
jgi:hypothetical protein